MKNKIHIFSILFLLFPLICICQKNNYSRFIEYNDEYLDRVLYSEMNTTSNVLLFYETIKSVYIQRTADDNELNNSVPFRGFYDENGNIIKIITYHSGQEYINSEYYYDSKYGGNPVYKSYNEYFNGKLIKQIKSEIDRANHIIINNHFSDDKITETDTIFYIENYKPIEIRKHNLEYIDKSIKKMAYLENGKIYKEVNHKSRLSSDGTYIRYNEFGKPLYLYNIKFDEFENILVDYEDSTKIKQYEFLWKDDKDFELREGTNKVTFFNFKEKKLYTKDKESTYTTFFNEDLLPVKKIISR